MNLGPNTKVVATLGVVITLAGAVIMGTWIAAGKSAVLDRLVEDHYGITAASEAALRQAIENPGMRVPDPRDPERVIVVETPGAN